MKDERPDAGPVDPYLQRRRPGDHIGRLPPDQGIPTTWPELDDQTLQRLIDAIHRWD